MNFLALEANWNFFAPNPPQLTVVYEWEALGADEQTLSRGVWPQKGSPFWLRERQNRRLFSSYFISADPISRAHRMLTPWICRQKQAHSVRIWRVSSPITSLEDAQKTQYRALASAEMAESREGLGHQFCAGGAP